MLRSLLEAFRRIGFIVDSSLEMSGLVKRALEVGNSQPNSHGLLDMFQIDKNFRSRWNLHIWFASVATMLSIGSAYRKVETVGELHII